MEYCSFTFKNASSKATFILQFFNEKSDVLDGGSLQAALCDHLIELLIAAETEHWNSLEVSTESKIGNDPPSPEIVKTPQVKSLKTDVDMRDEGEEGEVLEEADEEEYEEEDNSGKLPTPKIRSVLNVYRMKLACEVLPLVHRVRRT